MVEVLFSLGDWEIHKEQGSTEEDIWAAHSCTTVSDEYGTLSWFIFDDPDPNGCSVCYHCEKPVPDEVQGLVHLYHYGTKGTTQGP